jgi:PAS domain S-box-containing protein
MITVVQGRPVFARAAIPTLLRYGSAVPAIGVPLALLHLPVAAALPAGVAYLLLALGVLVSAGWGGGGPGILATTLGALGWFTMPGVSQSPADLLPLAGFVALGLAVSRLGAARRAARRAEEEHREPYACPLSVFDKLNRTLQALDATEAQFRAVLELETIGVETAEADGRLTQVSDNLCRLLGYSRKELLRTSLLQLTDPADRIREQRSLAQLLAGAIPSYSIEKKLVRADGRPILVRLTAALAATEQNGSYRVSVVEDLRGTRQVEQQLRRSEVRYRHVLETQAELICRFKPDLTLTYVNDAFCRYFGRDRSALTGQSMLDLLPEPARASWRNQVAALLAEPREAGRECRYVRPDGAVRLQEWVDHPLFDDRGRVVEFQAVGRDVTDRRRAEEALRAREEQLRGIVEAVADGLILVGRDLRVQYANESAARIFGLPREQFVGQAWPHPGWRATLPDGRLVPEDQRGDERALRDGQPSFGLERMVLREDGTRVILRGNCLPLRGPGGAVTGVVLSFTDVTERHRAEEALRRSEERFLLAVQGAGIGIWDKDLLSGESYYSPNYCRMLGYAEGEPLNWEERLHPEDAPRVQRALEEFLAGRRAAYAVEYRVRHRDGTYRWVMAHAAFSPGPDGAPCRLAGSMIDITEQRRLEEQLQQSQKMEAVGKLAGGIAHDFNNLLTGVLGNLALVKLAAEDPNRPLVETAELAAQRAAELTGQLLGFARRSPLRLGPVRLDHLADETVGILRRTFDRSIAIDVRDDGSAGAVSGDAVRLQQVLMNLCINARDAMPQGGTLTVETAVVTLDAAAARRHPRARAGTYMVLRVCDTGCGMDEATLACIFEPFFTTKDVGKGTGLGLAMAYGIVQQHQGWVECQSAVGRGTCFEMFIPKLAGSLTAPPEPAPKPAVPPPEPAAGLSVLLADDEEILRNLGRLILESKGYRVTLAADGQEAVDLFRQGPGSFALVVLDLSMPRLSGRDALRRLRELDPSVRVLLCSGYTDRPTGGDELPVRGFIHKPFRPNDLLTSVRAALAD